MNIFPQDTATKLIESLTGVMTSNMPIIIALLGFTLGVGLAFRLLCKILIRPWQVFELPFILILKKDN